LRVEILRIGFAVLSGFNGKPKRRAACAGRAEGLYAGLMRRLHYPCPAPQEKE